MLIYPQQESRVELSPRRFLTTEKDLSRNLGLPLSYPIRLFNLEGFGVDEKLFLQDTEQSFRDLPWDEYDMKNQQVQFLMRIYPESKDKLKDYLADYILNKRTLRDTELLASALPPPEREIFNRIQPYRRRAIATFTLTREGNWTISRIPTGAFRQDFNPVNWQERHFAEMKESVTSHPQFKTLLQNLAFLIEECRPGIRTIKAHCHQVSIVAKPDWPGQNSPEGIHQDGADYIVSAIVMKRVGLSGGISTVYGPDKKTAYLQHCLKPGEGIFQADKGSPLYHHVSSIEAQPGAPEHIRNIIGFDFQILA